jgi:hypothetical protein
VLSYLGLKRNPIVLLLGGLFVIGIGIVKGVVLALALGVVIAAWGLLRLVTGARS